MPLPDPHRRAAVAAFDLREPDVPVADLVFDSALVDDASAAQGRQLRFRHGLQGVDLSVDERTGPVRIQVRLVPPGPAHVEMRAGGRRLPAVRVRTDERGRVSFALAPQLVSFLVTPDVSTAPGSAGQDRSLRTAWVRL